MPDATDPLDVLARLEGVPQAVESARASVDVVSRDHAARPEPEQTAEALRHAAWASANLDGANVELAQLRGALAEPLAVGAVRVASEVLSLVPVVRATPLRAFARLHTLAARGLSADATLGLPRREGDPAPDDPLGLGPAPGATEVTSRLNLLGQTVQASTAPAIVVAAVAHGELLVLRPFGSANGVVARAAARLIMAARGFDPVVVTVPEVAHLRARADYAAAAAGYAAGTAAGMAAWIRHCAWAITQETARVGQQARGTTAE